MYGSGSVSPSLGSFRSSTCILVKTFKNGVLTKRINEQKAGSSVKTAVGPAQTQRTVGVKDTTSSATPSNRSVPPADNRYVLSRLLDSNQEVNTKCKLLSAAPTCPPALLFVYIRKTRGHVSPISCSPNRSYHLYPENIFNLSSVIR